MIRICLTNRLSLGLKTITSSLSCLVAAVVLALPVPAQAQVTITSVNPANGATGVSPNTQVVFTFSAPMYTAATMALFSNSTTMFITTASWNANGTVLTCTPMSGFTAGSTIQWSVLGLSASFQPLTGATDGSFSTASGSTSIGTNSFTSFQLLRATEYEQTSAGAPALTTNYPFSFLASANLISNRNATSVTLTLPGGAVSNLDQVIQNNDYWLFYGTNNLTSIEGTFPAGDYTFFVQGTASNQTVTVNFPNNSTMPQPNAPHISNYGAAQAVNPAQDFTLAWDVFQGGTASDYTYVEIYPETGGTVFKTPDYLAPGALTGTSTSVLIPAGTLQANSVYSARVAFYRFASNTNASYATWAGRASATTLKLATTSGASGGTLLLTNIVAGPSAFSFDVRCSASQTFTIFSTTDLSSGVWQSRLTTNPVGTTVHFSDLGASTNAVLFYRAKNGT